MFYSFWGTNFNNFGMMNPYSTFGSLRMYCPADRFVMPDSYFGLANPFMFNPMFNQYMMGFNIIQPMFNNMFKSIFNQGCNCRQNVQPAMFNNTSYTSSLTKTDNIFKTNYNISKIQTSTDNIFARRRNELLKQGTNSIEYTSKNEKLDARINIINQNKASKPIKISNQKIAAIVHDKAKKYGVDENLILAMINQESSFKNGQTSKKGAKGLMQLMPDTAKELGVTDINNPEQNIDAGVRYMKQLLNKYNGNVKLALAAYNAGMGNVKKYGGIPPFKETQNYVAKIYKNYKNGTIA